MLRIAPCAALLLWAALAMGQEPGLQPRSASPQEAASTGGQNQSEMQGVLRACAALLAAATSSCPGEQQEQPQPSPPQTNPQDKSGANSQIQSDLQSALRSDPALSGADVQVAVDDMNITLTGSIQSQGQMDRVMALTSPYARYRNVVNKIAVH